MLSTIEPPADNCADCNCLISSNSQIARPGAQLCDSCLKRYEPGRYHPHMKAPMFGLKTERQRKRARAT